MRRLVCLFLLPVFCLVACTPEPPEPGRIVSVYALGEPDGNSVLMEVLPVCPEDADLLDFVLTEVLRGAGGISPFPPGVEVTDFSLADRIATVTLSEEASALTEYSLTLARACVVFTLTGLDGIDGVVLAVEGQVSDPAVLRAADFILGALVLADTERVITLFFPDQEGVLAVTETRTLVVRETDTVGWYLQYALGELAKEPRTEGLVPVLPEGTELLSVIVAEGGVCTVNFSQEFVSNMENGGIPARMILYCLASTVTAQPGITALSLLTDGNPLETYGGINTSQPLTVNDMRFSP